MAYSKGRTKTTQDEVLGFGVVRLYVSFSPNGTSNVTLSNQEKKKGLSSVTAVGAGGAGLVIVQLDTNYKALLGSSVNVMTAADDASAWHGRVISFTSNTSNGSTMLVGLYKGTTATNVVANTGNTVTLSLALSKSNVWT